MRKLLKILSAAMSGIAFISCCAVCISMIMSQSLNHYEWAKVLFFTFLVSGLAQKLLTTNGERMAEQALAESNMVDTMARQVLRQNDIAAQQLVDTAETKKRADRLQARIDIRVAELSAAKYQNNS